jgi:hypothetical protein
VRLAILYLRTDLRDNSKSLTSALQNILQEPRKQWIIQDERKVFSWKQTFITGKLMYTHLPEYEDGINSVFRNVGTENSDVGELPRRKNKKFRTRRKFEIKSTRCSCHILAQLEFPKTN